EEEPPADEEEPPADEEEPPADEEEPPSDEEEPPSDEEALELEVLPLESSQGGKEEKGSNGGEDIDYELNIIHSSVEQTIVYDWDLYGDLTASKFTIGAQRSIESNHLMVEIEGEINGEVDFDYAIIDFGVLDVDPEELENLHEEDIPYSYFETVYTLEVEPVTVIIEDGVTSFILVIDVDRLVYTEDISKLRFTIPVGTSNNGDPVYVAGHT
ncbi:MAG: hypothetical protein JW702_01445, partial [Clostridiales bacterium]|nr:hypothetical protein [Clostridiales bacterium]